VANPQLVLNFWFHEIDPRLWFAKDPAFDEIVRSRFLNLHRQVRQGEKFPWRHGPSGRLAEILVLDQFSRNMFRDTAEAFQYDPLALILAQEAVDRHDDQKLDLVQRSFLYMPYMHSESPLIHKEAVILFSAAGLENNLDFELRHKKIIDRFGRYPHRNEVLGRASSPEEISFLQQPGSGF
jgi:uncharacterized protein (DUF924 family)